MDGSVKWGTRQKLYDIRGIVGHRRVHRAEKGYHMYRRLYMIGRFVVLTGKNS